MNASPHRFYAFFSRELAGTLLILLALFLQGCGAGYTAVKKRDLVTQTKMSDSIFLDPVAPEKRVVFVEIRNTTDQQLQVEQAVRQRLSARGYRLTDNPDEATFLLQANILQVGRSDLRGSSDAISSGFGGAVAGAVLASATGSSNREAAGVGVLAGAASVLSDAMVDDVLYTIVTDLQIRQRLAAGEQVSQQQSTTLKQGTSTELKESVTPAPTQWKSYRTRIVSSANQANLKLETALPALEAGLVQALGGLF